MTTDERNHNAISVDDLVEIRLENQEDYEAASESFLKIRETLTRIGVSSHRDKKLYQSCHILHKRGKYYIVHFKEIFALDGMATNISENDVARRNTITNLIQEWDLLKVANPDQTKEPTAPINQIKILPHREKHEWELVPKYSIGRP